MAKGNKNGNPNISQHLAGVRAKERQEAHDTLAKAKAEEQKHKQRLTLKRIDHKTLVMATDIDYYTEALSNPTRIYKS